MSTPQTLKIYERDDTLTPRKLRSIGFIPATVYGHGTEPFSIQIKAHEFELALKQGVTHFHLDGLGKSLNVQVKQLQLQNTRRYVMHVEFCVPSSGGSQAKAKVEKAPAPQTVEVPTTTEPSAEASTEDSPRQEEVVTAH